MNLLKLTEYIISIMLLTVLISSCGGDTNNNSNEPNQVEETPETDNAPDTNEENEDPQNEEPIGQPEVTLTPSTQLSVKIARDGNAGFLTVGDQPITLHTGNALIEVTKPGFSLYQFEGDSFGLSSCDTDCLATWPAIIVAEQIELTYPFSILKRDDIGFFQLRYNDKPLYLYNNETAAGNTAGISIGGWNTIDVSPAIESDETNFVFNGTTTVNNGESTTLLDLNYQTLYLVKAADVNLEPTPDINEENETPLVSAAQEYSDQCARCHGPSGNGTTKIDADSFSLASLALFINNRMPIGYTEECSALCAEGIASFIKGDYQEEADKGVLETQLDPSYACLNSATCLSIYPALLAKPVDILPADFTVVEYRKHKYVAYKNQPLHIFEGGGVAVGDNLRGDAQGVGPLADIIGGDLGANIALDVIVPAVNSSN